MSNPVQNTTEEFEVGVRPFTFADYKKGLVPPEGWDVADMVEDGWTQLQCDTMLKECICDELPPHRVGKDRDGKSRLLVHMEPAANENPPAPTRQEAVKIAQPRDFEAVSSEWVFLAGRGVFRNQLTGAEMRTEAFNLAFQSITPEVDFTVAGRPLKTPKVVSAADYLLGYRKGRIVHNTLYLPALAGPVVTVDGIDYLNSYLPAHVPKEALAWAGHWAVAVWEEHLRTILPDDWRLLLQWLAHNVQHPGRKILWAPIVKGTQGDGKTTISKMLGAVMGPRNVRVVSTESLFSDFTGYAEGACVAFLEEIRVKGHSRHDAMNKLKPLVTNEVVEVVRKGQDGRNVPNVTNYMAFTNFEDALVIDASDRRWGVFFTRFASRQELAAAGLGPEYWSKLHRAVEEHAGVLRAWLLSIDLCSFNPKDAPPITAAKSAMIASSIGPDAAMVAEMVNLGRFGVGHHAAATDCMNLALKADHGVTLATSRMKAAFEEIGWRSLDVQMKWEGKARRVYIDKAFAWPMDHNQLRSAVRDALDETLSATAEQIPMADPKVLDDW